MYIDMYKIYVPERFFPFSKSWDFKADLQLTEYELTFACIFSGSKSCCAMSQKHMSEDTDMNVFTKHTIESQTDNATVVAIPKL